MRPARVSNVILICAHSRIRIAEARVGFKAANRESFPYIIHIVDEPRKFSPSNVLTYTVCAGLSCAADGKSSTSYAMGYALNFYSLISLL